MGGAYLSGINDNSRSQCTGWPTVEVFTQGDYMLGGWGRAAIYKQPFEGSSCFDTTQNGDETGVDCGGSCEACGTGGYFGCYQDCGANADGARVNRVCDDIPRIDVTTIAECRTACANYQYMGLACPRGTQGQGKSTVTRSPGTYLTACLCLPRSQPPRQRCRVVRSQAPPPRPRPLQSHLGHHG